MVNNRINNRIGLWLLLAVFFAAACGGGSAETEGDIVENGELSELTVRQVDSLRQAYQHYYANLTDTFPLQCRSERGKVYPADQAPSDTAFFVFRESLREAVANKDIFKLLAGVDENIKLGFGGEGGLKDFIAMWKLDSPEAVSRSGVWPLLAGILSQGGTFNNQREWFEAPYISSCWPHDADPMEQGVIAGAGVRLRADPGLNTQVVTTLSHDVVDYLETTTVMDVIGGEEHPWIKVKTLDGKEGFVYGKFYASPLETRLVFRRTESGEWKLASIVAGD